MKKRLAIFTLFLAFISLVKPAFGQTQSMTVNTKADVPIVLELQIEQTSQSELRFGNLYPSSIKSTEAGPIVVTIHITSNIGETYQLTQFINNELENGQGDQINSSNLKFTTAASQATGAAIADPTPVTKAPQIIFVSDAKGTSETIRAQYLLTVPPSQAPGDYSALLTYTVSSL